MIRKELMRPQNARLAGNDHRYRCGLGNVTKPAHGIVTGDDVGLGKMEDVETPVATCALCLNIYVLEPVSAPLQIEHDNCLMLAASTKSSAR